MYPLLSQNRLKYFQKLNQKKHRDKESLYIVSGLRAISGALTANRDNVKTLIIDEKKPELLNQFSSEDVALEIVSVSEKNFSALVDEKSPQGICAIVAKPETKLQANVLKDEPLIYLDRINDPGNLGTIVRTAAWFGFSALLLSPGSADPFQSKAVRSSAGSILSVNIFENVTAGQLSLLQSRGYKIYATSSTQGRNLGATQFESKFIVMFGSEAHGLDSSLQVLADHSVSIPGPGSGESLNLAVAAAIVMYHAAVNTKTKN